MWCLPNKDHIHTGNWCSLHEMYAWKKVNLMTILGHLQNVFLQNKKNRKLGTDLKCHFFSSLHDIRTLSTPSAAAPLELGGSPPDRGPAYPPCPSSTSVKLLSSAMSTLTHGDPLPRDLSLRYLARINMCDVTMTWFCAPCFTSFIPHKTHKKCVVNVFVYLRWSS